MFVHEDLRDHEYGLAVLPAVEHDLSKVGIQISFPYFWDPLFLRDQRRRKALDYHVQHDLVYRRPFGQCALVLLCTVIVDLLEGYPGLFHIWDRYGPVIICGAEGDTSILHFQNPIRPVFFRDVLLDQRIDLIYYLDETDLHLLFGHLQFIDEAVHLVNEKSRFHPFPQRLPYNRLRLRHGPLHCTGYYHTSVNSSHGPCDVTAKINVTGGVDKIDQIFISFNFVNHGNICRIDRNTPCLLLFVEIEHKLFSGQFLGHHAGTGYQVIAQGRLPMVDVCRDTDIPDEFRFLH